MSIKLTCRCGRQMMVPDQRAGRAVLCPKCGERIDVPGERKEAAPTEEPVAAATSPPPVVIELPQVEMPPPPAPPAPPTKAPEIPPVSEPPLIMTAASANEIVFVSEVLPPAMPAAPPPLPLVISDAPPIETKAEIPAPPPPPVATTPAVTASPSAPTPTAPLAPPPAPLISTRPGYVPDPEKLTAAYVLAMLLVVLGVLTIVPGVLDVVRYLSNPDLHPVGRWTFVVFFLALLHWAYALYLGQLPDWSASWVLTAATLLQSAAYASVLTALSLAGGQSQLVAALDLGPHVDNGHARAWCFAMFCLTGLAAYFCGRVSIRWRRAFVMIRAAHSGR